MTVEMVLAVIDRFAESSLTELEWREGEGALVLRRASSGEALRGASENAPPAEGVAEKPLVPSLSRDERLRSEGSSALCADAASPTQGAEVITSPIVATFYASAGPDSPAFVKAGSRVRKGDTLCILEAMKMMNHLEAEFDLEVLAVKAKTGELVEFGQTLFEVRRL